MLMLIGGCSGAVRAVPSQLALPPLAILAGRGRKLLTWRGEGKLHAASAAALTGRSVIAGTNRGVVFVLLLLHLSGGRHRGIPALRDSAGADPKPLSGTEMFPLSCNCL